VGVSAGGAESVRLRWRKGMWMVSVCVFVPPSRVKDKADAELRIWAVFGGAMSQMYNPREGEYVKGRWKAMASQVDLGRERYGEQGSMTTGRPADEERDEFPSASSPDCDVDGNEKARYP
jgi:hypothetical protein